MKIRLLLAIAFFFSTKANSQITITSADLPSANNTYVFSRAANTPGLTPAATGPGYTWDYSQLSAVSQSADTFIDEASTASLLSLFFIDSPLNSNRSNQAVRGQDFNLGTLNVTGVFDFFYNSSASYSQPGFGANVNGLPLPVAFSPKDILYKFPLSYNDSDTSNSSYAIDLTSTVGIYYGSRKIRVNSVDGYGTLTTPYGSFNTLRVKTSLTQVDTVYIDSLGLGLALPARTTIEYKWLGANQGIPLLQINTSAQGQVLSIQYKDSVRATSIAGIENGAVSIYPNPANDKLNVSISEKSLVEIFNLSGQMIYNTELESSSTIDLIQANIQNGIYLVKITGATKSFLTKIQVN